MDKNNVDLEERIQILDKIFGNAYNGIGLIEPQASDILKAIFIPGGLTKQMCDIYFSKESTDYEEPPLGKISMAFLAIMGDITKTGLYALLGYGISKIL